MRLARLISAPSCAALFLSFACSDPPAPPAQGAFTIQVGIGAGVCQVTHGPESVPTDDSQNSIYNELHCDVTSGCKADEIVKVDRQDGVSVSCKVKSVGNDQFEVRVTMAGDKLSLDGSGTVGKTGGEMQLNSWDSNTQTLTSTTDNPCTVTIIPNRGGISKGKIWAQFNCPVFTDQTAPGTTGGCSSQGAFLFENCTD